MDTTDETEELGKRQKKKIFLKQYLVSGAPEGAKRVRFGAAILHTCPKLAAEEFRRRFPDIKVWSVTKTADSDMTKEDMEGRDFWKEHNNWIWFDHKSDDYTPGGFFGKTTA